MKFASLLLVGSIMVTAAHAQSEGTPIKMLPLPKTLPTVFFAPNSLAGAMLEPLAPGAPAENAAAAAAVVAIEPAGEPRAVALAQPETMLEAQGDADADGELADQTAVAAEQSAAVTAQPEPAAEEPAAAAQEPAPEAEQAPAPSKPGTTSVRIIVENVESNSGTVNVAVCDKDFSPQGCPYHTAVPASAGFVEAVIKNVPPGNYAVVGYHDVNNNDEFDKFLGVPREPYALSGTAAESLVPDFKDALLKINQGENYVIIRMKRLGSG